jgi:hypothetical protein
MHAQLSANLWLSRSDERRIYAQLMNALAKKSETLFSISLESAEGCARFNNPQ